MIIIIIVKNINSYENICTINDEVLCVAVKFLVSVTNLIRRGIIILFYVNILLDGKEF